MKHPFLELVRWFLIGQFIFIGIHLLVASSLTPILSFFAKRKKRKSMALKQTLVHHLQQQTIPRLPRRLRVTSVLLPTLIAFDQEAKGTHWNEIKGPFFEAILFPRARKWTYSSKWTKRIEAVGCFLSFVDPKNEPYILHLLKDPIPMVQYGAAFCAAKLGTIACTNAILDAMNQSDRFLRHPFREAFFKGDERSFKYIEERLESDADPLTHVSCFEVLSQKMNSNIADLARQDLHASHKNLRIAAIRALGHFRDPKSGSALLDLLGDPEWEVRAIAARSLGYLQAKEALFQLAALLKDKVWWVRMNSALALKRLGEEGRKMLEMQNPKEDRFAYEIAQYVLPLSLDA